jgi:DNA polymerase-3 subunit epsilon
MSKIIWLDLETTGLNKLTDQIVEIGVIYEDTKTNKTEEFHRYIKYDEYPEKFTEAVKVHGLSPEILEEKGSTNKEVYNELLEFLDSKINCRNRDDKSIISGYNVKFDIDFTRELFYKNKSNYFGSYFFSAPYEVMTKVAECLIHEKIDKLINYKLETVAGYLQIDFNSHSAIEDIKATRKVDIELNKLLKGGSNE